MKTVANRWRFWVLDNSAKLYICLLLVVCQFNNWPTQCFCHMWLHSLKSEAYIWPHSWEWAISRCVFCLSFFACLVVSMSSSQIFSNLFIPVPISNRHSVQFLARSSPEFRSTVHTYICLHTSWIIHM